jgi:hypothetical protein
MGLISIFADPPPANITTVRLRGMILRFRKLLALLALLACLGADGSLRVRYGGWDEAKIFRPGESLELVAP